MAGRGPRRAPPRGSSPRGYNAGARRGETGVGYGFGVIVGWALLSSGDEAGDAGLDDGIESHSGLDSLVDLPHGVFGKGGDVKVFLEAAGGLCGGQERGAALDGPGEGDLGGGFADTIGDGGDDGIGQQVGLAAMTQRGEGLHYDSVLSAIVQ